MATQVQTRRGTTAQHSTFTGAAGELTVDTDKKTVVVHDGTTAGGAPLLRENGSQNAVTTGTSTAASFIPTSSTAPTNGVYLPAANSVAISTNGTGRLFVDSSGKIGVGSSSDPGNIGSRFWIETSTDTWVTNSTTGSGNLTGIHFRNSNANGEARILNNTGGALTFYRSSISEAMRITSAGLVGIGTSSPISPLSVAATTNHVARFTTTDTGVSNNILIQNGSSYGGGVIGSVSSSGTVGTDVWGLGTTDAYNADFTPVLNWTASGRVGIGTTPSQTFQVLSPTEVAGGFERTNADTRVYVYGGVATANLGSDYTGQIGWTGTSNNYPFAIKTVGSERLRVDTSGRLLVGTSSARSNFTLGTPTVQFETATSTFNQGLSIINNGGTVGYDPTLTLGVTRGTAVGSNTAIPSAGYGLGRIDFAGADGTTLLTGARIAGVSDGGWGTNDGPSALVFSTTADGASSPTERMRITSGGYLKASNTGSYLGSTSAYHEFSSDAANIVLVAKSTSTGAGATAVEAQLPSGASGKLYTGYASSLVYQVLASGNVQNANNSYGSTSDLKLKENIVDASSQWSDIKALQVRKYNFKEGQTHTQIGLIAQEVELVSPGLVSESPDRDKDGNDLGTVTKSVNYSVLYMKAVKALQEAMERIETLEAKVAALEAA